MSHPETIMAKLRWLAFDVKDYRDLAQSQLSTLRAENERLRGELQNIANANTATWDPEMRDQFKLWAQNRARTALQERG